MVVVVVWGPRRPEDTVCDGLQANPPELDQAEDLASLVSVNESSVLNTLLHRYQAQLPPTSLVIREMQIKIIIKQHH